MVFERLRLLNFKNYEEALVDFGATVNCLVGANGTGKTNLLDALHYLALTKSGFNPIDQQNVKLGEHFFLIQGKARKDGQSYAINCALGQDKRKVVSVDNLPYTKLSEHIGQFPIVLVAPDDTDLIREGSEARRRFFDSMISQTDSRYLAELMRYQKALRQRNALLKQFHTANQQAVALLEPYNAILIASGKTIASKRERFVERFSPVFSEKYQLLTQGKEQVSLAYNTKANTGQFAEEFAAAIEQDFNRQFTTIGIHRDDFPFYIDGMPLKKFGSQGQQKSFVIALKLAQFTVMEEVMGSKPVLLLDDIFDKLDESRMAELVNMVSSNIFGQVFITDARPERSKKLFADLGIEVRFIDIESLGGTS